NRQSILSFTQQNFPQIQVGLMIASISFDYSLKMLLGFRVLTLPEQRQAQVKMRGRVLGPDPDGPPILFDGAIRLASLLQRHPENDSGLGQLRVEAQGGLQLG